MSSVSMALATKSCTTPHNQPRFFLVACRRPKDPRASSCLCQKTGCSRPDVEWLLGDDFLSDHAHCCLSPLLDCGMQLYITNFSTRRQKLRNCAKTGAFHPSLLTSVAISSLEQGETPSESPCHLVHVGLKFEIQISNHDHTSHVQHRDQSNYLNPQSVHIPKPTVSTKCQTYNHKRAAIF